MGRAGHVNNERTLKRSGIKYETVTNRRRLLFVFVFHTAGVITITFNITEGCALIPL